MRTTYFVRHSLHTRCYINPYDMSQSWRECFLINAFTWCCICIENFPGEKSLLRGICWLFFFFFYIFFCAGFDRCERDRMKAMKWANTISIYYFHRLLFVVIVMRIVYCMQNVQLFASNFKQTREEKKSRWRKNNSKLTHKTNNTITRSFEFDR